MKIKTQFNFNSTANEVIKGQDLSDKRAVVTGAASGIGLETARALAGAGAEVTLAVRNIEAGRPLKILFAAPAIKISMLLIWISLTEILLPNLLLRGPVLCIF
ncbi:SDR family NAD(P)-dependent oxidoreductase [Raoultella planticola]|nr:SDR family NAD(P)-dependent oxidoreductase [Raoultella planticola]MDC3910317.1 SDR family NAD(P)-dependent oxidoreductase [Raoultella planticola]